MKNIAQLIFPIQAKHKPKHRTLSSWSFPVHSGSLFFFLKIKNWCTQSHEHQSWPSRASRKVQSIRATLCPEVNQHLWPSPHPRDLLSDGPLCSRYILPWRKLSWHAPTQSHQDHQKEKAQQHCLVIERNQKAPTASLLFCISDLLCTEKMDEEQRERSILFPWSYTFASLFRELNYIKCHYINYHYCGTSLAFLDCIFWYIWKYPLRAKSSLHSIQERDNFQV